jgi:hypothetical protein
METDTGVRLHHFSDDPGIECLVPRPVQVPSRRAPGQEWLNGPLVWAIETRRAPMYLFPRDCPRILLWSTPGTTVEDRRHWLGASDAEVVACIEWAWFERVRSSVIHRYDLPPDTFEDLQDAGMFVSRVAVTPIRMETIADLPAALRDHGVELRICESLAPLARAWDSTLHVSGIRLRNAGHWDLTRGAGECPERR